MEVTQYLIFSIILILAIVLSYIVASNKTNKKITKFKSINKAISESKSNLKKIEQEFVNKSDEYEANNKLWASNIEIAENELAIITKETATLQALKNSADILADKFQFLTTELDNIDKTIIDKTFESQNLESSIKALMSKLDLYSRIDEYVEVGHFEVPEYLFETSLRYTEEIKRLRNQQKQLIKDKEAISYPIDITLSVNASHDKKILDGQIKLMLSAFNIECDLLISNVNPGNFSRILERIEKTANNVEKCAADLQCGFNLRYVELKFEECKFQYQFKLKKQEEQEEQSFIKEQIREEQKAIKEYERAIAKAEKEERMYRDMLTLARQELAKASDDERIMAELRIDDLEKRLAEAEETEKRAKSMAEQTKRGHVYVISNIGSFGENVYKIGLTRRLEPMDRVKELGGASVPFSFDVHAMIYSDNAPALEASLHREFTHKRVNAVNRRKEFFRTDLFEIKDTVEKLTKGEYEFKITALAEDYYETRRLQSVDSTAA